MIKIKNPFRYSTGYNCFACSPENSIGLKMVFFEEGEEIVCKWLPNDIFQGYQGVLHGGIQSTLIDEIGSWLVNTKLRTAGVTSSMKVRFLKPVRINSGEITLRATLIEKTDKTAVIKVNITNSEGVICADAEVEYFVYPEGIAKKRLNYPGYEAFYDHM